MSGNGSKNGNELQHMGPSSGAIPRDPGPLGPQRNKFRASIGQAASGGGGKRGGGRQGGRGGGYGKGIMGQIKRANASETNALMHFFQGQIRDSRNQMLNDIIAQRNEYRAGKGDMNYVHNQVGGYLGNMRGQMNQNFNQANTAVGNLGSQLVNQLGAGTDQARQAALQEQARLGIQQSGMGQFDADANNNTMVARQGTQDVLQNLALDKQGSNMVSQLLGGMNQGSRASVLGQLLNDRNRNVNDLRQGFLKDKSGIVDQMQQARMEQAAQLQQMLLSQMQANQARRGYGGGGSSGGSGYSPYTYDTEGSGTRGDIAIDPSNQHLANLLLGPLVSNQGTTEMGSWADSYHMPGKKPPKKRGGRGGGRNPAPSGNYDPALQSLLFPG